MLSIICIILLFLASHCIASISEGLKLTSLGCFVGELFLIDFVETPLNHNSKLNMHFLGSTNLILNSGYPAQVFTAKTEDGYLLQMHRIPYGRNEIWKGKPRFQNKPVVFLQHGLLGSSLDWVINSRKHSFAFMLADAGFDVWMGNSRGNCYTRHRNYSRMTNEFWQFTWDQMAHFDLDAMIDLALTATDQTSLHYVGFSEGTLQMFAKLSLKSESFNKKIRQFFALAPIATVSNVKGLLGFLASKLEDQEFKNYLVGDNEFLIDVQRLKSLDLDLYGIHSVDANYSNMLAAIAGPASDQLSKNQMTAYLKYVPVGTSAMNILHWLQMIESRKFQRYSFCSVNLNQEHYGEVLPPEYKISKIDVPTYLYWSCSDLLANKKDIERSLINVLHKDVLKESNHLEHFSHIDFVWGLRAASEVYRPVIKSIKKYLATDKRVDFDSE